MKYMIAAAFALTALSGCVSSGEIDKSAAWDKCQNKRDRAERSKCITQQISKANAERAAEMAEHEADVAAEESESAVEQAYGVPDDKAGGPIRPATRP